MVCPVYYLSRGFSFTLHPGLILRYTFIDFIDCAFAGITILFLEYSGQDIDLSGGAIQVVIGEFAPPGLWPRL